MRVGPPREQRIVTTVTAAELKKAHELSSALGQSMAQMIRHLVAREHARRCAGKRLK